MTKFNHEIEYRGKEVLDSFDKKIIICGCGAIGSNLALNLTRQGFSRLVFIDFDRVEESNLGTQVYNNSDIGRLKVKILSDIVSEVNYDISVESYNKRLDINNISRFLRDADLIIDAFDNTESRQLLKDFGIKNNTDVLHGGLYEDYGEVFWNQKYKVPQVTEGQDVCDYPLARNIILLLTAVMSEEIIKWATMKQINNWSITLNDLQISKI